MKTEYLFLIIPLCFLSCKKEVQKLPAPALSSQSMCAPVTSDREWYNSDNIAPLFENLGDLHLPITTDNKLVQRYFNQGVTLAYGFNHAEAARSFYYATKLDPDCAMAYWGYAYVLGPNYNAGMESDNYERAYEAIQKALTLSSDNATEKEKRMIHALSKRYVEEPVDDRFQLDVAYSNAMAELYKKFPDDADIGAIYAESQMNLHPWDLYDKSGIEKEWTRLILTTLETVIAKHPRHSGAHHFYIHAIESSKTPELGLASAALFDNGLVSNAGHLVHMPSHIYIRTGDYHKGTMANINAVKVDSTYISSCHAQGAYPLAYFPHNQHFLAATATLEGNSYWALKAADAVSQNANLQLMKEPGWGTLQHYYSIPFYLYTKFGKWNEILKMENKVPELPYPTALFHYARGMALLSKGNKTEAKSELVALNKIALNEQLKEVTIWDINSVYDLVQIARNVLQAEILAKEGNHEEGIKILYNAIAIEDQLNYNEPPDWFFSVRHNLGALQLESKLYEDAINTYQEDLKRLPRNGWALKGLSNAYKLMKNDVKANEYEKAFQASWTTADLGLQSSMIR